MAVDNAYCCASRKSAVSNYLHERRYGAFERVLHVPEGVDAEKIEATFKNGVLALTLPKTPEAQKPE